MMERIALYHDSKEEIWNPVKGYEGLYEVSSFGRVRSLTRKYEVYSEIKGVHTRTLYGRVLKPCLQNSGYQTVWLRKEGGTKACTVHRLVAMAFVDNPLQLAYVNHKDGNKQNNCLDNLEWCSSSENLIHAYNKLDRVHRKGRSVLCVELNRIFPSIKQASIALNVNSSSIGNCLRGDVRHAGGYSWKGL